MKAEKRGGTVVVTLTAKEAYDLENELLWGREDDEHCRKLWEALSGLGDAEEATTDG